VDPGQHRVVPPHARPHPALQKLGERIRELRTEKVSPPLLNRGIEREIRPQDVAVASTIDSPHVLSDVEALASLRPRFRGADGPDVASARAREAHKATATRAPFCGRRLSRIPHFRTTVDKKAWTQEDLAGECDLDRSYISGLEFGRRNPTYLMKIAKSLGISLVVLLDLGTASRK